MIIRENEENGDINWFHGHFENGLKQGSGIQINKQDNGSFLI
jgi:hypothetical protein